MSTQSNWGYGVKFIFRVFVITFTLMMSTKIINAKEKQSHLDINFQMAQAKGASALITLSIGPVRLSIYKSLLDNRDQVYSISYSGYLAAGNVLVHCNINSYNTNALMSDITYMNKNYKSYTGIHKISDANELSFEVWFSDDLPEGQRHWDSQYGQNYNFKILYDDRGNITEAAAW